MKRSEILSELKELEAESANMRGWHDALDARIAALKERLSAPVEQPARPEPDAGDLQAMTLADLVTPKQLGMIRALGRECGVDWEVECQTVMRCKVEELSKRGASSFIDYLKTMQEQGADFRKVG